MASDAWFDAALAVVVSSHAAVDLGGVEGDGRLAERRDQARNDMTPTWERAVHEGDIAALARELAAGGDIDARDRFGQTALMLAAVHGDLDMVAWIIEHGAALDVTAKFGLSAVMLAVVKGQREIVPLLVAGGADLSLRGSGAPGFADRTAYDLAVERGDDILAQLPRRSESG